MRIPLAHRFRSGIGLTLAATLLALGTAAAPAKNGPHSSPKRGRLVANPASLAPASTLAPGDRIERLVQLRPRGKSRFSAIFFVGLARKSSGLDGDHQNGLQISIDRCSKKWRTRGLLHTCRGKRKLVLRQRPLIGRAKLKLGRLTSRKPAYLRLILTFPVGAGNALEAQTTDATYRFVGMAR